MSGISRNSKRHDVGAKMEHPCWHARGKGLTPMAQMRLSRKSVVQPSKGFERMCGFTLASEISIIGRTQHPDGPKFQTPECAVGTDPDPVLIQPYPLPSMGDSDFGV